MFAETSAGPPTAPSRAAKAASRACSLVLLFGALFAQVACAQDGYTFAVTFEPESLADRVDRIRVTLVDTCDSVLETWGEDPDIVRGQFNIRRMESFDERELAPGFYGFYAIGFHGDGDCRVAAGCEDHGIEVGGKRVLHVLLEPIPETGDCPDDLDAGVDGSTDGGRDAGENDAGTMDSGVEDAGCTGGSCGIGATEIALGSMHSCALRTDSRVACWGANNSGQVGNGGMSAAVPSPVVAAGLTHAQQLVAGGLISCALRENGTIVCWGDNRYGQLGSDPGVLPMYPMPTPHPGLSNVRALGAGERHDCAILVTGRVRCWGSNDFGALGNNMTGGISPAPQTVSGLMNAEEVHGGMQFTCARTDKREVYCWGQNNRGQLGDGTRTDSAVPRQVEGLADAISISLGAEHACALREGGEVRCWGDNTHDQLIDVEETYSATPVSVGVEGQSISAGKSQVCALLEDQTVSCWGGSNDFGELGNGAVHGKVVPPSMVVSLTDASALAQTYGAGHMCALRESGGVVCWGDNRAGQVGMGRTTTTPVTAPTQVLDF